MEAQRKVRLGVLVGTIVALGTVVCGGPADAVPVVPPPISLDTGSLTFGPQAIGTASGPSEVTLTNQGDGPAHGLVLSAPTDPEFSRSATTCGTELAGHASCTISYRYAPTDDESDQAVVGLRVDGGGSARLTLFGDPDVATFPLAVSGTSIDFGPVAVGTTSPTQPVTILNPSSTSVSFSFSGTGAKGPFSMAAPTCAGSPVVLAPGASCQVRYRLKPTAPLATSRTASLQLAVVGGPTRSFPVELAGFGGTIGAPPLRVTPRRLDFGPVPIGTTSAPQVVTITNTWVADLPPALFGAGGPTGAEFTHTTTCGPSLAKGASCTATYQFQPGAPGLRTAPKAAVQYSWRALGTFQYPTPLFGSGTGSAGRLTVDRIGVALGTGTPSTVLTGRTFRLRNTGTAPLDGLTITNLGATQGPVWDTTDDCPDPLPAAAGCDVSLRDHLTAQPHAYQDVVTFALRADGQEVRISAHSGPTKGVYEAFAARIGFDIGGGSPPPAGTVAGLEGGYITRHDVAVTVTEGGGWARQQISLLYQSGMDTLGDSAGLKFWGDQLLQHKRSYAQIAAELYGSNRAVSISGGTDAAWLARLYRVVLGRGIDPGGLAYWQGQVAHRGRPGIALTMYDSPEGRRVRVRTAYGVLSRAPDPSGLAYWSDALQRTDDLELKRLLASSDEYLRLCQYVSTILS